MDTPGLIRTLRRLLQAQLDPAPTPGIVEAARAHRLAGVLHAREVQAGRPSPPELLHPWTEQLAGHLTRLEWIQTHWPKDLPLPMRFKGADLADHLYPDPGCRSARDLDLLVPASAWPDAVHALAAYAPSLRRPTSERWPWDKPEAAGFLVDGLLIELHRIPGPPGRWPLDPDAIYARSQPAPQGWGRVPSPPDRCMLWLVDAAKAGFHGDLAHWWDLALMRHRWPDLAPSPVPGLEKAWALALSGLHALGWDDRAPALCAPPRSLGRPPHEHQGIGYQLDKLRALSLPGAARYLARAGAARALNAAWRRRP